VRRVPVAILAAAAALLLAACGGGGSPKVSASATTTTSTPGRGFQNAAFTACLHKQGITLPAGGLGFGGRRRGGASGASGASGATGARGGFRGGFGGGPPISIPGVSAQKLQTAFAACRSSLPNGGRFGGGVNPKALQAYLSCLGDHGVVVPTTTTGASGATGSLGTTGRGAGSQLRALRSQPKYAAAAKTCRPLLPTFGGGGTTTSSPG
jgi:hypothetical protein